MKRFRLRRTSSWVTEGEVRSPGRYQELDLFIKVLRLLCPNLTDASPNCFPIEDWWSMIEDETVWLDFVHEASGFFFQPSVGRARAHDIQPKVEKER